jgi:hypothetical protein
MASKNAPAIPRRRHADFCNKIGTKRTNSAVVMMSVVRGKPEVVFRCHQDSF